MSARTTKEILTKVNHKANTSKLCLMKFKKKYCNSKTSMEATSSN